MTKNKSSKSTISTILSKIAYFSQRPISCAAASGDLPGELAERPAGLHVSIHRKIETPANQKTSQFPIQFTFFPFPPNFPICFLLLHSKLSRWTQRGHSSGRPASTLRMGALRVPVCTPERPWTLMYGFLPKPSRTTFFVFHSASASD